DESIIVRGGNGKDAGVWWFDTDGLLRAAWSAPLAAEGPTALSLPSEGRWSALSGGTVRVFIHHDDAAAAELPVQAMPDRPAPGKPIAHGSARHDGQPPAWWYVDDDHTLVWSGKPWIPFGGMFVSPVLAYYDRRSEPLDERWRLHAEALDRVQAAGFDELYINLGHGPVELRQQVADDLNRRGIRFG